MANKYLDNKRFEELILLYVSGDREVEEELIGLFDVLIDNIITGFKFNLSKDDAKQDCFVLILKILPNFKEGQGKAFNYFTTVILHHLKFQYTKNKKYKKKISEYIKSKLGESGLDYSLED